tara:strand:- start:172 stop:294 length:123 start_codon:yes stop_codon:yes gene_type:complete
MKTVAKILRFIGSLFSRKKEEEELSDRLKNSRKNDPFIYD